MSSTAEHKATIRKALATQLKTTLTAASVFLPGTANVAVLWAGLPLDIAKLLKDANAAKIVPRYVRMTMHWGPDLIFENGSDPRIEGGGHAKFGIFTATGSGEDANDALCKIVAAGFPFNTNLVREALNVRIDTIDAGEMVSIDGWDYAPLRVNWNVWRV